jgi:signal transduction histidine kinase
MGMAYNKLGVAYMEMSDFSRARNYFDMALEISGPINFQVVRYRVFHNLYLLAKREGNEAMALDFLEKHMQCKDAVVDKETYNLIKSYDAVSQIERLEQEAKQQQERNEIIERKNAELDSFFYRVSHDIKGPISSLMGLSSLVSREITHPESLKLFNMYHSQILRVNDIVMGLINLTRISNQ